MLRRRSDGVGESKVFALEASHLGPREFARDIGVLAGALGDAAPARIAGDVEHGRENHRDAVTRRLRRRRCGRRRPEPGIEGAGFAERNGEHGFVPMQHVEADEQRDAETALRDGGSLDRADSLRAPEVQQGADAPGANVGADVRGDDRPRHRITAGRHGELADLFLKRHGCDELGDLVHWPPLPTPRGLRALC